MKPLNFALQLLTAVLIGTMTPTANGQEINATSASPGVSLDALVSKTKLPEGEGYNIVVQFKQTAKAKPTNLRFKLLTHTCGECKRTEYACICGH